MRLSLMSLVFLRTSQHLRLSAVSRASSPTWCITKVNAYLSFSQAWLGSALCSPHTVLTLGRFGSISPTFSPLLALQKNPSQSVSTDQVPVRTCKTLRQVRLSRTGLQLFLPRAPTQTSQTRTEEFRDEQSGSPGSELPVREAPEPASPAQAHRGCGEVTVRLPAAGPHPTAPSRGRAGGACWSRRSGDELPLQIKSRKLQSPARCPLRCPLPARCFRVKLVRQEIPPPPPPPRSTNPKLSSKMAELGT